MTSSSCNSYADESFPSAPSQSAAARAPGQTLGTVIFISHVHRREGRTAYQIHDDGLVNLLPQVSTEDLDERDLERRNLAVPTSPSPSAILPTTKNKGRNVHEDTRQIQLHLETNIHIGPVNSRTPPKRKPPIRNLIQPTPLRIRQLLIAHALLEPRRLLPEQTLPSREVRALEQGVLENTLDTSESSDDVDTVVVELPQLAIVTLRRPPEGIAAKSVSTRVKVDMHCRTYCLSSWYCFQSVRTRQPRS